MKTNIEAKFKLIEILNISPVELSYIKDLTIPENIVSELLNGESDALKVHLENIQNDETLPVDTRLLAACLKNKMKDSVIRIKMDGLDEDEDEDDEVEEEESYGYFDEDLTEEEKEAIKENEKERNKMWRDREIEFHKSIPILKKYTQEEMNSVMFNYIWEHFPLLQKGSSRNGRQASGRVSCAMRVRRKCWRRQGNTGEEGFLWRLSSSTTFTGRSRESGSSIRSIGLTRRPCAES